MRNGTKKTIFWISDNNLKKKLYEWFGICDLFQALLLSQMKVQKTSLTAAGGNGKQNSNILFTSLLGGMSNSLMETYNANNHKGNSKVDYAAP